MSFPICNNSGNENEFQRLILDGININATDEKTGNSVLILAIGSGKSAL